MTRPTTAILAWGNTVRTDDGVGVAVAERLRAAFADDPAVEIHVRTQLGPELAEVLARAGRALFIDAHVDPDGEPVALEPLTPADGAEVGLNHQVPPEHLLALAAWLYGRTPEAHLLTVRAHDTGFGETLSPETERWVDEAVRRAMGLIRGESLVETATMTNRGR
jgi:hydrogenase maturation protease